MDPLPDGNNGRSSIGQFTVGHKFATGNIRKTKACKLRTAILDAITEGSVAEIMQAMIGRAIQGDIQAAKLILGLIGKFEDRHDSQEITDANFLEIKRELLSRIAETN